MAQLSHLRRRMIEDMTVRNMSPATQRSYVSAVSKFSRYFGKSPERLSLEDVRAFQVHLVSTGISWPGLNQIVCALRFFYGVTLGEAAVPERIPYAREPRKLPIVLSADEVVRFLEAVSSLKSRAALTTAYAAGLRASEVAGLRVADIDSARGVILVRHGKGAKDRNVMLSAQLLGILRAYWRLARPTIYLFPGRDKEHSIDPTVLHAACRSAVNAAGLTKRVTLDTASYCPPVHEVRSKSSGSRAIALIRSPFCVPRITWTASSSPRLTRCNTVWRETPSAFIASRTGMKPSPASLLNRAMTSSVKRMRHGAPGVSCSPGMIPALSKRWRVEGATPSTAAAFLMVNSSPSACVALGSKQGISQCRRRLATRPASKRWPYAVVRPWRLRMPAITASG